MKCDLKECEKDATVHLTEIVNGNITKLHLCEEHAKQKGVEMEQHFGIADLLQGLSEVGGQPGETDTKKTKCTNCGMTYDDYKKIGRLGCGDCYRAFKESLAPLLKRIHGSTQHIGKTPLGSPEGAPAAPKPTAKATKASIKAGSDLDVLKEKLRKAIHEESYEEAARIRDQIRQHESVKKAS